MTQKNYTDITIVLDRSGSMSSMKMEMEQAVNDYIQSMKNGPGKCTISVVQFNTHVENVVSNILVENADKISIVPSGGTALYDAVCKTIVEKGNYFASLPEAERPDKVLFIITTDGEENSSQFFRHSNVHQMISEQRSKYQWEFVFLGANIDSVKVASSMGINANNSYNYTADANSTKQLSGALTRSSMNYRKSASKTVDNFLNIESNELMTKK